MSTREQSCGDVTLQSSTRVACGGRGQALQPARPSCKPQAQAGQQPGCCRVSGAGGAQLGRRRALLQPLQDGSPRVGSAVARAGGSWSCSLVQPCGPGPRQWPHLAARAQAPLGRTPPWHPRVKGPPGSPSPREQRRHRCLWGQGREGPSRPASPPSTAARRAATRVVRCICLKKNCL